MTKNVTFGTILNKINVGTFFYSK